MPNRCVIDGKLRFEFARDLEQTIFHAFTLRHPNLERELDDEEFKRLHDAHWCCSRVSKKVLGNQGKGLGAALEPTFQL